MRRLWKISKTKWYSRPIYLLVALALVLSLGIMAVPMAGRAEANGIHYYVSTTGSNTTGDGSEGNPWQTINYAIGQATGGDTINVAAGNYTENVDVDESLTLQGGGSAVVTVTAADSTYHVFEVTADNVNISGFTVKGATGNETAGIYVDNNVGSCNITANACLANHYGIYLDNSDNNTLTGNTANSNSECGIYLDNSDNNTLTSNTANSNTKHGIYLDGPAGSNGSTLNGNTANQNGECGIYVDKSSNNTLTSNTANSNTEYGIYLDNSGSNNLAGNTMSGNSYNFYVAGSSLSHYDQSIDITNTVDEKPIYYLVGLSGQVVDGSTNAGYVGAVNSTNVTVKDLTLTKGGQGVLFAYTSHSSIENVTVSNNYYGIYLDNSDNNTLTSNCITSNNIGIKLQGTVDASTTMNFNNIHGNTEYGVENSGSGTADATNNWWGDASGPSAGEGVADVYGTGDAVSANVNYDPWHLKQIGDLTAGNPTESCVDLFWTTTGAWDGDYFDVRYATSTITSANWNSASRVGTGEPTPSTTCNASQGMKVSGLSSSTTYYFGLKLSSGGLPPVVGDIGSSDISNIASATTLATAVTDTTPPSAITDLAASAGTPPTTEVILSWTAKGDDEAAGGIADRYIIKRSTSSITAGNFDSATTVYNELTPKPNGESESFTVSRLTPNTTYYFAIKIQDEVPNTSAISNVVPITTTNLLPTVTDISPTTGDNGQAETLTITGTNFISSGTTVVRFISDDNTFDLTSVTYDSLTQLTAVVPQGAPMGTYKARVINDNGTSALSSATYVVTAAPTPLPVVTNVIPQMAASNTAVSGVQIFGENLTGATAVKFGDTAATSFTVISDTKITADAPGLAAGEYDVKVTTAAGTNSLSAVKFQVCDPVVINADATQDITTSGAVDLGDTHVTPVQLTLTTDDSETATQATDTDAEIEVVIPPQTTVTDSEGNAYTENINPPRVVKPDESVLTHLADNAVVVEMGNPEETIHLDKDCVVRLVVTSSTQPLIWYYNKDTKAYELAGKDGTIGGVTYVQGGTKLGQDGNIYTMGVLLDHMSSYINGVKPTITSAPVEAIPGENITITGVNFDPVEAEVYFDGTAGSIISRSLTQIVLTVPGFEGTYTLKVENRDGLCDTTDITLASPDSPPVGGEAYPVNKLLVLAPWIALAAAIIAGASLLVLRRRRA